MNIHCHPYSRHLLVSQLDIRLSRPNMISFQRNYKDGIKNRCCWSYERRSKNFQSAENIRISESRKPLESLNQEQPFNHGIKNFQSTETIRISQSRITNRVKNNLQNLEN